jgi:tubulin gamma
VFLWYDVLPACTNLHGPQLFGRVVMNYDKLRKKGAFLDVYRKEPMFRDDLDEFDSSREVVQSLIDEYKAAETEEYVHWGSEPMYSEYDDPRTALGSASAALAAADDLGARGGASGPA